MAKVELSKEIEVQEQPVFADVENGEFFGHGQMDPKFYMRMSDKRDLALCLSTGQSRYFAPEEPVRRHAEGWALILYND